LIYQLKYEGHEVSALGVDYGQRHLRELESAKAVAAAAGVPYTLVDMAVAMIPVFKGAQSSQVGAELDVPHGHYAAENMKTTIVPNRNMLLISLAGALAESIGATLVCFAAHAGDHAIYPDCRPEFNGSAAKTLYLATDGRVTVYNPFIVITKTDIAKRAKLLRVPVELTWSCYDPKVGSWDTTPLHCGLCGTCVERKEAFADAGIDDPTVYAA
jgi:7-cyano-7-deazaguanine synthase